MQSELYELVEAVKAARNDGSNLSKWFSMDRLDKAVLAAQDRLNAPQREPVENRDNRIMRIALQQIADLHLVTTEYGQISKMKEIAKTALSETPAFEAEAK